MTIRKISVRFLLFALLLIGVTSVNARAQQTDPPKERRTTRIDLDNSPKSAEKTADAANSKADAKNPPIQPVKITPEQQKELADIEEERLNQRRQAAMMALYEERREAARKATDVARTEFEKARLELVRQFELEKIQLIEDNRKAIAVKDGELKNLEAEKQKLAAEMEQSKAQAAEKIEEKIGTLKAEMQRLEKEKNKAEGQISQKDKQLQDVAAKAVERDAKLDALRGEIGELEQDKQREIEKITAEANEKIAQIERETKSRIIREKNAAAKTRSELIRVIAQKAGYLDVEKSIALVPDTVITAGDIESYLLQRAEANQRLVREATFCDADFKGRPLNLELTANDTFEQFLQELRVIYGINFLPDPEILKLPVRVNVQDVPWNVVLQAQLNYNDLLARCTEANTIAVIKRGKLETLSEANKKSEALVADFIKLKHLRPAAGGGSTENGGKSAKKFSQLEAELGNILKQEGFTRGSITRVPGQNEFFIKTTPSRLAEMKALIARTDTPQYQVVLSASVLTLNENKIKDIGGSLNVVGGKGDLSLLGGLLGFGGVSTDTNSTGGDTTSPASTGFKPGGVPGLGDGFSSPNGGSSVGLSTLFGTVQFAAQLNLLKQQGVVKVDNRPLIVIPDGDTGNLKVGRNVYVPIQASGLGTGTGQVETINAGSTLTATPQVIFGDNGEPVAVNLSVSIESNDVDTTVISGGIPSVIQRSLDTTLTLNASQTAVIGGFTTSSRTKSESKTPFFGDLPIIGSAFKRRIDASNEDKLYFTFRVDLISEGQVIKTIPVNVTTIPTAPDPSNDFFNPYNQVPGNPNKQ